MTELRVAYDLASAAEACGVSTRTLQRAIADGNLTAHYPTTKVSILRTDLEAWIVSAPTARRAS